MWATLVTGTVWHGELVNKRKDGTFYTGDTTITPVRGADGQIAHFVAILQDVTERRSLEDRLRQSQKLEAIGLLAGGVAHDFNNILSAMLMQVELVEFTEALPGDVTEGLKQIRADVNRAADLTRQLLLFSRRQVMQPRQLDLNEVVSNMAMLLQRIIGEDVRLQLNLHSAPLMVRADPGMIEQVLMNLAVNARDAMPEGGRLRIDTSEKNVAPNLSSLYPDAVPGPYACFSVSDTGPGIPPEILPRIFEPFFTTKEAGKGTGLGLATIFGIVKQHQGWIKVDNQPGHGVSFRIFLPASTGTGAEAVQTGVQPKRRNGSETILLVEDESRVRESIATVLKRHGYQVVAAANAVEARELWPRHRREIALLLTDLVMPGGISGQELARQIQAAEPKMKVVYISGYSREKAGRELQLLRGEKFIQKPFSTDHLLQTIRGILDE
jgi:signal transduction histidine kinase/CheY-like chemotaxis protein